MFRAGLEEAVETADKYRMVTTLRLNNFRCFESSQLNNLRRINLVVGRNGTGKTALLESLFLASGASPELALRLRHFRGMGQKISGDQPSLAQLWHELAFGFQMTKDVVVEMIGSDSESRSLTITTTGTTERTLPLETPSDEDEDETLTLDVNFMWKNHKGEMFGSTPTFTADRLNVKSVPQAQVRTLLFPSNFTLNPEEASIRLSSIRKRGDQQFLLDTVRTVFSEVDDISAEVNVGTWLPHVSVRGTKQMIPAALFSAGASRFIAYIAGIAAHPRGLILIDEVENGIYYKAFPKMWEALHAFCDQYETQLFVTTHSAECLEAVKPVVKQRPDDFSLIRANREQGETWLDSFSGDQLADALEQGFELR